MTGSSESEAASTSHGPTRDAYPADRYQQRQQQRQYQHLPIQPPHESDDGVFAYRPPSTADQHPQLHKIYDPQSQYQDPQHMSQHEHLSAAQLHNLVASLSTSGRPPSSGLSSIPEFTAASDLHSFHAHDQHHHDHPPETSGPNSYSMRSIPFSPGILEPQDPYPDTPIRGPFRVTLPTTTDSYDSPKPSPPYLKCTPSDLNTSALDIGSRMSVGSPTSTQEEEDDSPYIEVRASVSNMDDPEMPTTTFRMWFLGLTLVLVGACLNIFFTFRYPAPYIMPSVVLLIAHPLGKTLAYILPTRKWVLPQILGGGKFTLNPGPFNVKEHVLIYMMANVAISPAYMIQPIVVAELYYGLHFGLGFEVLLVLATTLTGFGLAGICRRFLVWPTNMLWPQNLVSCTLLNTLHEEDKPEMGSSRYRFLLYAMAGIFLWTFFPGLLFTGLSFFSWVCWIAPSAYPFPNLGIEPLTEVIL